MGQYYKIVNVSKREAIFPLECGDGSKLTEFAFLDTATSQLFHALMHGRWKGDVVAVLGDYADDEVGPWTPELNRLMETLRQSVSKSVWDASERAIDARGWRKESLYERVCMTYPNGLQQSIGFEHVSPFSVPREQRSCIAPVRYIANHKHGEYVDLKRFGKRGVDPLILLLAMGNGCGGGDYSGSDKVMVGAWAGTSQFVEFSTIPVWETKDNEIAYKKLEVFE